MRTLFLILTSAGLLINSLEATLPWTQNEIEAMDKAKQNSLPVIVFFTGTGWCTWCVKLEKEVLDKQEFAKAIEGKFVLLKADFPDSSDRAIDASPYKKIMDQYGVDGFPTLVVIDGNGQKLFEMGYEAGGVGVYPVGGSVYYDNTSNDSGYYNNQYPYSQTQYYYNQ